MQASALENGYPGHFLRNAILPDTRCYSELLRLAPIIGSDESTVRDISVKLLGSTFQAPRFRLHVSDLPRNQQVKVRRLLGDGMGSEKKLAFGKSV